jgi:hypothetical protein
MCDLVVLFLHLIVSIVRLIRPGGARSIVAESVLVKQQLLILESFPEAVAQSEGIRPHRRRLVYSGHASRPPDPLRNRIEAVNSLELPPGAEEPEVPLVVLRQAAEKAGTKRTRPGSHCSGCGNEATQSELGVPSNCSTDRVSFRY